MDWFVVQFLKDSLDCTDIPIKGISSPSSERLIFLLPATTSEHAPELVEAFYCPVPNAGHTATPEPNDFHICQPGDQSNALSKSAYASECPFAHLFPNLAA